MECIFLNAAGTTLFVRDDMESGHWVQQEMNMTADFPFVTDKKIERGMRIAFRDPITDILQVFEIRVVTNQEPDHFQQITAEHIALSELSDEHINSQEITDKTAAQALTTALIGTLWSVGNNTASGTQNADISRGSVWDAVNTIKQNWNVYIEPRIVISSAGVITGRYLDISPADGVWRGVRLSVRKNMIDPAVTYDDEEVYTALYGYGGSVEKPQATGDDKTEELTFADVVWSATSSHPAKPSGQTYLEWPEKTALYGRNGRPRFGYYQNGNIKDANLLLEKTWESLKQCADPKLSISGTIVDLYRLGYHDEPIRLHDIAIIEIDETGEIFQKQIICCDIDLIDPTGSRVEIGDYIPNIIYINRDTADKAGGGGGGGGGRGMTKLEDELTIHETWFEKNDDLIGLFAGIKNGDGYLKVGQICLAINDSDDILANIKADHVNISATSTAHMLAGSIVYDANGNLVLKESTGGGVYVEHNNQGTTAQFGVWDRGNLTGLTIAQLVNGETSATINADHIYLLGETIANTITADYIKAKIATIPTLTTNSLVASSIQFGVGGGLYGNPANAIMNLQLYQDGNNYQIWGAKFNGDIVKTDSFSRAITSASWGWSGSAAQVTLAPQGQSFTSTLLVDNYSLSGSPTYNSTTGKISQRADILDSAGDTITYFNISIDATAAYNAGWNACRQYAIDNNGQTVLTGYSTYNSGRSTSLYTEPSSSASIASGAARVWRYGGSTATRYTLPAAK